MLSMHNFRSKYAKATFGSGQQLWDTVIFKADHFIAIPTLGALVEGWLLVVPRDYYLCMGELDGCLKQELLSFVAEIVARLEVKYGPVAVFEHGPSQRATEVGCGVDYAHLHLVPTRYSLMDGARVIAPHIVWKPVSNLTAVSAYYQAGKPYLYLEQPFGSQAFATTSATIPSQFFRRVIARYIGKPDLFDWKFFTGFENIMASLSALQDSYSGVATETLV